MWESWKVFHKKKSEKIMSEWLLWDNKLFVVRWIFRKWSVLVCSQKMQPCTKASPMSKNCISHPPLSAEIVLFIFFWPMGGVLFFGKKSVRMENSVWRSFAFLWVNIVWGTCRKKFGISLVILLGTYSLALAILCVRRLIPKILKYVFLLDKKMVKIKLNEWNYRQLQPFCAECPQP